MINSNSGSQHFFPSFLFPSQVLVACFITQLIATIFALAVANPAIWLSCKLCWTILRPLRPFWRSKWRTQDRVWWQVVCPPRGEPLFHLLYRSCLLSKSWAHPPLHVSQFAWSSSVLSWRFGAGCSRRPSRRREPLYSSSWWLSEIALVLRCPTAATSLADLLLAAFWSWSLCRLWACGPQETCSQKNAWEGMFSPHYYLQSAQALLAYRSGLFG